MHLHGTRFDLLSSVKGHQKNKSVCERNYRSIEILSDQKSMVGSNLALTDESMVPSDRVYTLMDSAEQQKHLSV